MTSGRVHGAAECGSRMAGQSWWGDLVQPGNLMSDLALNLNKQNVNIDTKRLHSSLTSNATHKLSCLAENRHQGRPSMGLIWPLNPVLSSSKFLIIRSKHLRQVLRCAHERQCCRKCLWRSTATRVMEMSKLLSGFAVFSHEVCSLQLFIDEVWDGV